MVRALSSIPLLIILGPTATGKTQVAVEVAAGLGGEIVSADSMQVYRELDIGTAKPTAEERRRVPHHLVDVVDPGEAFNVARFQQMALKAIRDIHRRGRLPLLVGGTGLYIRALAEGFVVGQAPPDWDYRRRLEKVAARRGTDHLHRCLSQVDPEAAREINQADLKRVIRALEVFRQTGTPKTQLEHRNPPTDLDLLKVGLDRPREELYRRIDIRVERMIESGWIEEVRRLLNRGLEDWVASSQALGYRHLAAYVRGHRGLEETIRLIKRDTRRFAKRQLTWFRRERGVIWVPAGPPAVPDIASLAAGKWPGLKNP